ncbi:hypothetical protein [Deinococcus cellulosilyticus]|uniref:Uncharacterized protein n=1 Tax=Deinococcus cellulosilyticus (strain DSM 18568 / NBRC 106333 / KACC 11606 / 5516J-15) TaxID=1223518 RepID=A0A511N083_DEIC1|nr:hypothetical protein [Deinococcus cellulosilyticus]GEM45796.1 hypothetical protein DC3_14310 [Deinococcus cellulosilyticus NBRC 106333 = KACC 11606]
MKTHLHMKDHSRQCRESSFDGGFHMEARCLYLQGLDFQNSPHSGQIMPFRNQKISSALMDTGDSRIEV